MKVIIADYIMICNKNFDVLRDSAICFDENIIDIGNKERILQEYSDAKVLDCGKNSVLLPGLINTHIHLEFSANKTTLKYGDFIEWLHSVIEYRDELTNRCDTNLIESILNELLKSGTTTIGAISSYGLDLEACSKSPINTIYFNEVLGSQPSTVDAMYQDFLVRFEKSKEKKSENFYPSIAIHSPYSTHPILAKKVLSIAKNENLIVSTHFMESYAEREWIDSATGDFISFFKKFLPNTKPVNKAIEYLELFRGIKTLFTHAVWANDEELTIMSEIGSITHCAVSNRLLNNGVLNLERVEKTECPLTIGTDGLSSNNSVNLWDELRCTVFLHANVVPTLLAKKLLLSATNYGAIALGRNSGVIERGKNADIITVKLPDSLQNIEDLALQTILHTKKVENLFIKGIKYV